MPCSGSTVRESSTSTRLRNNHSFRPSFQKECRSPPGATLLEADFPSVDWGPATYPLCSGLTYLCAGTLRAALGNGGLGCVLAPCKVVGRGNPGVKNLALPADPRRDAAPAVSARRGRSQPHRTQRAGAFTASETSQSASTKDWRCRRNTGRCLGWAPCVRRDERHSDRSGGWAGGRFRCSLSPLQVEETPSRCRRNRFRGGPAGSIQNRQDLVRTVADHRTHLNASTSPQAICPNAPAD